MTESQAIVKRSVHTLVFRSLKRAHDMFLSEQGNLPDQNEESDKIRLACKAKDQYGAVLHMPNPQTAQSTNTPNTKKEESNSTENRIMLAETSKKVSYEDRAVGNDNNTLVSFGNDTMLVPKRAPTMPKPVWHPRWKNYRVISGHTGWVRCIAFDPTNEFFATGAADRMIKIWDLASGTLKLSLTGHVSTVRGVVISDRQPYLFSCGEDKMVRCWDLEQNKVVRHYHGHMSAVYGIDLHPSLDVLVTCSRDATARVWDMRTRMNVHVLQGHTNTVATVKCQETDPQIITGSHDSTIRLWDIVAGKTMACLTNHKKSVRSVALHPKLNAFVSASADNIKEWKFSEGTFLQNLSGHNAIINGVAVNEDNVVVSAADNGSLYFWDWTSGYNFDHFTSPVQPGSIDSESGVFAVGFDRSGSRFATCNTDKTIKFYKECETDTEENFPLKWRPNVLKKTKF